MQKKAADRQKQVTGTIYDLMLFDVFSF